MFNHGVLQAPCLLEGESVLREKGQKFSRRDVTCVTVAVEVSRVSLISDGLHCGKTQVAEKVSQQVDTLGELGSDSSCWLEMSFT